MTLREAEAIGQLWLDDLQSLLDPAGPRTEPGECRQPEDHPETETEQAEGCPKTLRDCFVDDEWQPEGFPNPVAAINWLTAHPRKVGEMTSAELVEGATQIQFQLSGDKTSLMQARIVVEHGAAKCQSLTKSE